MFDRELFARSLSALHDAIHGLHQFSISSSSPGSSSADVFRTGASSFAVGFAITAIAGVAVAAAVGGTLFYSRRSRHKRRKKKRFPLTQKQWREAFDAENGRLIGNYKLLKKIRLGGIEPSIRAEVWPFLLGFYSLESTRVEREAEKCRKRKAYEDLRRQCNLLREKTYGGCLEGKESFGPLETGSEGSNSTSEEVQKEAARNFAATLHSSTDDASSGLDSSREDTKGDCREEPLNKVQDASIRDSCLNATENVTYVEATEDDATSGLDGSREGTGGRCKEEPLNNVQNASVEDSCVNAIEDDAIICEKTTEDAAALELENGRGIAEVECKEGPLNKVEDTSIEDSCLETGEDVTTCVKATEDDTSSGLDSSRGNTEGDHKEESLNILQNASIEDSFLNTVEDVITCVNATEDDNILGLDNNRKKKEGGRSEEPLNNVQNASIEDSSLNTTEEVTTCVKATEDDVTLGLDNNRENKERGHNDKPLNKVQDASIEDGSLEAGEDVITCAKPAEDAAISGLESSRGKTEGDCKEILLNNVQNASIDDSCLNATEDVITWQRIIRLDAVRMNAEWVPYSPTQASVTGEVAQELATSVGLMDDEHLEPCRQHHAARLVAILEVYALYDSETGYCQGMSDLLSPFVALLDDDYEAFWCFVEFMNYARFNFRKDEIGIRRQLDKICSILRAGDPRLYRHLEIVYAQDCFFVYRMVIVLMRRELSFEQTISLWEVIWAEKRAVRIGDARFSRRKVRRKTLPTNDLLLYVIAAAVCQRREVIIQSCSGLDEILRECNSMAGNLDVWALLDDARDLVSAVHGQILD